MTFLESGELPVCLKVGTALLRQSPPSKAGADLGSPSPGAGSSGFSEEKGFQDVRTFQLYPWSKAAFGWLVFQKGPGSETLADWLSSRSMDTVTD